MPERFKECATHDPFAITPDPKVYVPRAATETARKELLRSASNPAKTTALMGPPGLGKTLLLHLLAEEVPEDLQTVYLPYAALPPEELCDWALRLVGWPGTGEPIGALQAHIEELREQGSSLLLLIDDAGSMPVATARWAGGLVQNSGGSVRLAIATSDNATGNRTIAAIGSNFDVVHLDDPMTESETSQYIEGRLALARAPDSIRARFDDQTVRLLHRISAGIPRRLHSAAAAILQEAPVATPGDRAEARTAPVYASTAAIAAPTAPVHAPVERASSAQTLGVPPDERRVSSRRAEQPEGVAVRVGLGGPQDQKGRRAEDRVELPAELSEPAVAEFAEAAPNAAEAFTEPESIEAEEIDDDGVPDREVPIWEAPIASPMPRRAPPASRRAIILGTLLVAFAAVAIPVIRSILADSSPIAATDRQAGLRGSVPGVGESVREDFRESLPEDLREPWRGDFREPLPEDLREPTSAGLREPIQAPLGEAAQPDQREPGQGDLGESSEAFGSGSSVAREEIGEIRAVARAEESLGVETPAVETLRAEPRRLFAVQINASPWANVEVDGIDLGATPLANIPLFGGAHAFRVKMPDGRVIERTIEIDAESRFVSFE